MNTESHYSSRWAPWFVVVVTALVLSPFIGVALYCSVTPEPWPEAARIAIPIALPALYLTLQVAFNRRYVTVTPDGVRVTNGPFPGGVRLNLRRDHIASCYLRQIVDRSEGREMDRYFLVGVETKGSKIQDVSGRINTAMEAQEEAYKIRGILNAHPSAAAIEVAPASSSLSVGWRMIVVIWAVVFMLATIAGGVWENDHSAWRPPPRPTR
ncbi:MAG: hypothetical protein NTV52_33585 [Acidobacteria bacterium]|nr:hypothetical protein [Acidobacteriota bacterium]